MRIDFEEEPPFFEISPTHFAKTWLRDPRAPKIEMPEPLQNLHEKKTCFNLWVSTRRCELMAQEREVLVSVRDLEIKFKDFVAVSDVNFDIYKGETFSLVGESGSEKLNNWTCHYPY